MTEKPKNNKPAMVTNWRGSDEKAEMPVSASFKRVGKDQPVVPASRCGTSNGTCTWVKPSQAVIPRKKTLRSRICCQASTALRLINLKSETPFKFTPASLFNTT